MAEPWFRKYERAVLGKSRHARPSKFPTPKPAPVPFESVIRTQPFPTVTGLLGELTGIMRRRIIRRPAPTATNPTEPGRPRARLTGMTQSINSSGGTTIMDFIEARLRDDEDAALAFDNEERSWRYDPNDRVIGSMTEQLLHPITDVADGEAAFARHIERHDPARILREVQAKRQILGLTQLRSAGNLDEPIAQLVAASWSDHKDFQPEWTVQ